MTKPQAILVSVWLPQVAQNDHLASLAEMRRLAHTLGFEIAATVTQKRQVLAPAAVLGEGKLKALAKLTGGDGVITSGVMRKVTKAMQREQPEADEATALDSASGRDTKTTSASHGRGGDARDADADFDADGDASHAGDVADFADADSAADIDHAANADIASDEDDASQPILDALVGTVIVDNEISPAQIRNLERATGAQVFDRPGVIIEIFHRHARTREARLQVELARLAYEAPRLREKPSRGDRQRTGSVGSGESDLELDRRRIRDRMAVVRRELDAVGQQQSTRRARRREENKVALVGYTNAGKSSLMRALTGSEVLVADQLFATLGPTVRALVADSSARILISDTVGFIKNLPHDLVASFRSTLDEARDASLLLFVVDASDPDFRSQLRVTQEVLAEIGVQDVSQRVVLNKCDCLDADALAALAAEFPGAAQISTRIEAQVAGLRDTMVAFFERDWQEETFAVPYTAQTLVRELHLTTRVLSETYDGDGACLRVRGAPGALEHIRERLRASRTSRN